MPDLKSLPKRFSDYAIDRFADRVADRLAERYGDELSAFLTNIHDVFNFTGFGGSA